MENRIIRVRLTLKPEQRIGDKYRCTILGTTSDITLTNVEYHVNGDMEEALKSFNPKEVNEVSFKFI